MVEGDDAGEVQTGMDGLTRFVLWTIGIGAGAFVLVVGGLLAYAATAIGQ